MEFAAVVRRTVASLQRDGVCKTFAKFPPLMVDLLFDLRHGIETCRYRSLQELRIESVNRGNGYDYKATRVMPLRRLIRVLTPFLPDGSVFVDLGCGKGRALLVAAESGFATVRGVEFAPELSLQARRNIAEYKKRTGVATAFEVIDADVTTYEVRKEENVFFIANPFNASVLGGVLDNVSRSLQKDPRKIWIIYYNPRHHDLLDEQEFLATSQEYVIWDDTFAVYSN